MENKSDSHREEKLKKILASLHSSEPEYPDDFEDKFLAQFHARMESEAEAPQATTSLKERISNFFNQGPGWKWVYSSMALGTACIVALILTTGNNQGVNADLFSGQDAIPTFQPVSNEHKLSLDPELQRQVDPNADDEEDEDPAKKKLKDQSPQDPEINDAQ